MSYVMPDGTTREHIDSDSDYWNAWTEFMEPILKDQPKLRLIKVGWHIDLLGDRSTDHVTLPLKFAIWLVDKLNDYARLAAQLADAQRTAQAIMEGGGLHEDCADCAVVEWLRRVAETEAR